MKLVIAKKPSVAQSLAKVIGANKRQDGYREGNDRRNPGDICRDLQFKEFRSASRPRST